MYVKLVILSIKNSVDTYIFCNPTVESLCFGGLGGFHGPMGGLHGPMGSLSKSDALS